MPARYIGCREIWSGVHEADVDVRTRGLIASLYSSASDGGKGGDVYHISVCSDSLLTRVAIADVTGHGETVSHLSEWLRELLRARIESLEGNSILTELNALVAERGLKAMTTATVATFYTAHSAL